MKSMSPIPDNIGTAASEKPPFLEEPSTGDHHQFSNIPYNVLSYLDSSGKDLAKRLHEAGYLYGVYGALDGLSNAYSFWKYIFDIIYTNTSTDSTDALHDWMLSPEGVLLVGFETIALIAYSTMGNYFSDDSENLLKRWIAQSWPYVRDCIKGTKNAFKGLKATLQVSTIFTDVSLRHLLVPTALILGICAAANRMLLRQMYSKRKEMMRTNKELLLSLQRNNIQTNSIELLRHQIVGQDLQTRRLAYLGAAFGGLVDGMYMYMGILGLAIGSVAPPILIFLACCSLLYLAACIATRLYEESYYQLRLDISVVKVELAIAGKLMDCHLKELQPFDEHPTSEDVLARKKFLEQSIHAQLKEFSRLQKKLSGYYTISWQTAFLMGIRHGLSAYGALTSWMFAAATILLLFSVTLPPVILVSVVCAGLVLMGLFLVHAFSNAHQYRQKSQQLDYEAQQTLNSMADIIGRHQQTVIKLKPDEFKTKLFGYMTVDPSPQFFFQEWFEVVRSFFSGIGKGSKSIDYTMVAYQEMGEDGHYHHDNAFILCLVGLSSTAFALCLALRALCKGFGRPPVDEVKSPPDSQETPPPSPKPPGDLSENQSSTIPRSQSSNSFFYYLQCTNEKQSPSTTDAYHSTADIPHPQSQPVPHSS